MCVDSTPAEADNPSTPRGRPGGYHRGKGGGGFDRPGDVPGSDYSFGIGPFGAVASIASQFTPLGFVGRQVMSAGGGIIDALTGQKDVATVGVNTSRTEVDVDLPGIRAAEAAITESRRGAAAAASAAGRGGSSARNRDALGNPDAPPEDIYDGDEPDAAEIRRLNRLGATSALGD